MIRIVALIFLVGMSATGAGWSQTVVCEDQFVEEVWARALDAYEVDDHEGTAREIDALLLACEDDPVTYVPRILRTEIALAEDDFARAREFLSPLPNAYPSSIAAHAAWLKMVVFLHFQDEPSFDLVRDELLATSHAFLADPDGPASGQHIETWDTDGARISSYETKLVQGGGSFYRRYFFVIAPTSIALPRSVTITHSAATELMAELGLDSEADDDAPTMLAVDGYDCSLHSTLDWIPSEFDDDGPSVRYETAKAAFLSAFDPEAGAITSTHHPDAGCSFSQYITPVE